MSYGLINTSDLTDIADAIRAKLGVQTQYKPGQMADAIESISGGGITPTGTKQITANGTYDVTSFANAEVSVPQSGITPTGTKQISIISNGTTTEDVTAYANAEVVVNVPTGITPTGTKQVSVTQNGTTTEDVTNYASVEINANVVNADYENALVALGVQSDLANSITALTTYANGVTGAADTNLSDAVASLASGYGQGGGSFTPPWVSSVETVTIGANSVSNTSGVKTYFDSYTQYFAVVLKTAPNTNNQIVAMVNNGASAFRYKNGTITAVGVTNSYDAVLVEGTQYDVYHY